MLLWMACAAVLIVTDELIQSLQGDQFELLSFDAIENMFFLWSLIRNMRSQSTVQVPQVVLEQVDDKLA